jgi:endonuclease III
MMFLPVPLGTCGGFIFKFFHNLSITSESFTNPNHSLISAMLAAQAQDEIMNPDHQSFHLKSQSQCQ